ncbi:MAG: hypothetical protein IJ489_02795 [Clostridia bacterium]|nr:hypothetical protein [Clostridia bacterium]
MKKLITLTLSILMLVSVFCLTASADDNTTNVYVTIADEEGKLVLAQEKIAVTDTDNDGSLTISDVLYAAHEAKYDGGAAAGYGTANTEWGLSLMKLWGVENGGSYGYYVNNASAMGLTTPVKDGDRVNAFIYTDLTTWSDTYCYFDIPTAEAEKNSELTLTLKAAGYDENYAPVTLPVANATITIDGETTEYKTDAEGKVTVKLDKTGELVVSAVSDTQTLVPPVCKVTVTANDTMSILILPIVCTAVVIVAIVPIVISLLKKKNEEK